MTEITDTRIPLKTPRDIDVAVSTMTKSIQFAAGLAPGSAEETTSLPLIPPHQ